MRTILSLHPWPESGCAGAVEQRSHSEGTDVVVRQCDGGQCWTKVSSDHFLIVEADHGDVINNFSQFEGARGSITYGGTWSSVTCACASQGAMKKTSAKGASFTYTDYWNRDDHLGLVMAKGPSRGSADVYVDGVKVATVNTYSATVQNRVIVYDKWMAEGTHTVKVVNLATSGHGRIDLDAVLNS